MAPNLFAGPAEPGDDGSGRSLMCFSRLKLAFQVFNLNQIRSSLFRPNEAAVVPNQGADTVLL
jgi:hypothetical protein